MSAEAVAVPVAVAVITAPAAEREITQTTAAAAAVVVPAAVEKAPATTARKRITGKEIRAKGLSPTGPYLCVFDRELQLGSKVIILFPAVETSSQ